MRNEKPSVMQGIEETPAFVKARFAETLANLPQMNPPTQRTVVRPAPRIALILSLLLALAAVAFALRQMTVSFFYTERVANPVAAEKLSAGAVEVIDQYTDMEQLHAQVTSAAWLDGDLVVTVGFTAKDGIMPLPKEAMGVDGMRHDHIWWGTKPEILTLEAFTKRYGEPLVFVPMGPEATQAGVRIQMHSGDWLQEQENVAYLFRMRVDSDEVLSEGEEITVRLVLMESITPGFDQPMQMRELVFSVSYIQE